VSNVVDDGFKTMLSNILKCKVFFSTPYMYSMMIDCGFKKLHERKF
jgi:hypothetical protein